MQPDKRRAAATVLVSLSFLGAPPNLKPQAILVVGQSMQADTETVYSRGAIRTLKTGDVGMINIAVL